MKLAKYISTILTVSMFFVLALNVHAERTAIYPNNGTATSTTQIYGNSNRIDPYTPDGTIFYPYTTLGAAGTAIAGTGLSAFSLILAPGTYVQGAPFTFPNVPFYLQGSESTLVFPNGTIAPNSFDIFDVTIAGSFHESDNNLSTIHQVNNSVFAGPVQIDGLGTLNDDVISAGNSLTISPASLTNVVASALFGPIYNYGGVLNLNDDQFQYASSTIYALTATTTAFSGGNFSNVNILGATIITTSTGGAINVQNGATSTPNNLTAFSLVSGGPGITAGSAATDVCSYTSSDLRGNHITPTGTALIPCWNAKLGADAQLTVGSTTPDAKVSIHLNSNDIANYGSLNTIAFSIGSSTPTATTTLISISNTGATTIGTTTPSISTAILNVGANPTSTNGTTTMSVGKIQINGQNSAGAPTCAYVVGTVWVVVAGVCNQ